MGKICIKGEKSKSDFMRGLQADTVNALLYEYRIRIDMCYIFELRMFAYEVLEKKFSMCKVFKVDMMSCWLTS